MAFNINPGKQQFSATAAQTVFNFNFAIFVGTDLKVYKTLAGALANDTTDILILSTHYTVSINGTLGGTVTLLSGASLNDTITVVRSLPITRTTDYVTNGDLYADTLDLDQDYQTYLVLDQNVQLERAIIVPESLASVDLNIPAPVANSYLRWNATADALENDTTIPSAVTTSAANAAAAALSASNASTSETNTLGYLNDFKGRYYGALAIDPTLDPLGVAMTAGDLYWDTTIGVFKVYSGSVWVTAPATASQITNTPAGNIASTDVQAAINELDIEKLDIINIHAAASKSTPVDADELPILDSAATFGLKKLTWLNLKATLKTYFDTLYTPAGAVSISGVRQTVQTGSVDTNGFANFISIGTGLNVNIAATTTPLKINVAGGAISADRLGTISADTTLLLGASVTSYIYADVALNGTVTLGSTTLVPVYQVGGTPSITNGQFTFNIGEMKAYRGNGTTALQVYSTFIGEAVTSGVAVTSVITYALNGIYDSGWTATIPSAAAHTSKNSNLGVQADIAMFIMENTTTNLGYAVGDQLSFIGGGLGANFTYAITSAKNTIGVTANGQPTYIYHKTSPAGAVVTTAASWKWKLVAKRGW